jgi:hypothetical protein
VPHIFFRMPSFRFQGQNPIHIRPGQYRVPFGEPVVDAPASFPLEGRTSLSWYRTYAQHLNHWGTAEGVNPLGPLEIL